ncbi:unnamed protein product [Caenorhabditis sp. 36 PRJEB53466]|nr:unnamed protein product [Caenorhabditis sp. 36 PRJEB53466]
MSRQKRARNRLIILFIFGACLTSLYILLLKIKRMYHLTQMEENSRHFAIINDIVFYNSTYSSTSKPSFMFLITSQITNFYLPMTCSSNDGYSETTSEISIQQIGDSLLIGTCSVVDDPLYVSLKLDDFNLQIDMPDSLEPLSLNEMIVQEDHVICMSHLVLYEDGTTILSLLKHFKNSAAKIMIYAASVSDSLYKALEEYSENIEVIPWMLPESKKRGDFDKLKLDPNYSKAGMEGSLTHCFLKYAPVVQRVTLIDLATLKFNSIPFGPDYTLNKEVTKLIVDEWRIKKLINYRVTVNSQNDVVLHEKCFVRQDARDWEKECGDLRIPDADTPSRSVYIPKVIQFDNLSIYEDALGRCTSYKSTIEDRQKLMKFEFELENRVSSEVCEIELMRDDFKCRVAMDYSKKIGIGQAAAALFAGEGAQVVISGRDAEKVEKTRQLCISAGARSWNIHATVGDLMDEGFLSILVDTVIETFGKLDILINNAGSLEVDMTGKQGWEMSAEVMEKSFRSNFYQVFLLTQKAFPHLEKSKGDIVNVSTFLSTGPLGVMSMPYYAVPKAALDQMSRSMAHEYMLKGVRVGDENARKMESYVQSKPEYIPLGRVATANDVAQTILFLADRKVSECIVGQSIILDGGSRLCCNIDMSDYKEKMNDA